MNVERMHKVLKRYLHCTEELVSAYLKSPDVADASLRNKIAAHADSYSAKDDAEVRWASRMNSCAGDAHKAASARAWLDMHLGHGDYLTRTQSLLEVAYHQAKIAIANPLEPRYVFTVRPTTTPRACLL